MEFKIFKGFEDIYPERIEGTDAWYYGQWTPCSEPYEVPEYNNEYLGTKLFLIEYPSGKIHEPIKSERNIFLTRPVYDNKDESFGFLRYDFNGYTLQVVLYNPKRATIEIPYELTLTKDEKLPIYGLIISPIALISYEMNHDRVNYIWPANKQIQLEENEFLKFQTGDKLYSSKWVENPDYSEEYIVRDAESGDIIERNPGYLKKMPNGLIWLLTE